MPARRPDVPILAQEALSRARSPMMPITMALYVSTLGLTALLLFSVAMPNDAPATPNPADMANVAFLTAALQLALALLVVPALAAPALAAERERGTLDLLRLGRLEPRRLVAAKLFASLAYLALLVAVAFPVLLAVFLYAGLGVGPLIRAELLTLGSALALGSMALALGARLPRAVSATVAAYALALAAYGLTVPVGARIGPGADAAPAAVHPLVFANPFDGLHSLVFPEPPAGSSLGQVVAALVPGGTDATPWGPVVEPWVAALAWQGALGGLALLAAGELVAGRRLATRPVTIASRRARPAPAPPDPE
ncbi:MAG: ABC transporter permease [Acidimicrobiales bacterium]